MITLQKSQFCNYIAKINSSEIHQWILNGSWEEVGLRIGHLHSFKVSSYKLYISKKKRRNRNHTAGKARVITK